MKRRILLFLAALAAPQVACSDAGLRLESKQSASIPKPDELRRAIEKSARAPGVKLYVGQEGRLVQSDSSSKPADLAATVRSFDPGSRTAQVELSYEHYRMPILQTWRYDGRAWTDSLDPGIFANRR